jgi:flagellar export protein FliJ
LQARIETLHAALARQETELEKVRAGYLAASRNRKVLDKLRERQGEAYRKQQGREEGTRLDEIAAQGARGR